MYTCIQDFTHIERFVIINYDLPMEVKLSCEAFMYERGDKIKVKYNEVIQDSFLSSSAIVIVAQHHRNKMSLAADFINKPIFLRPLNETTFSVSCKRKR